MSECSTDIIKVIYHKTLGRKTATVLSLLQYSIYRTIKGHSHSSVVEFGRSFDVAVCSYRHFDGLRKSRSPEEVLEEAFVRSYQSSQKRSSKL
jgi:hypothetical protein